jgi:uncharacterized spore protein YtfJ
VSEIDSAMDVAGKAVGPTPTDRLLERLIEKVGGRAGAKAVFGEPVERAGVTVIPVAKVRWGFGGGQGVAQDVPGSDRAGGPGGSGSGSGGGGGVSADPIGMIEIGPDGARFVPIVPPYPSPLFLVAAGLTSALVLRAIARLVRG